MKKRHLSEVQDWMSENPIVVGPDASLADAYTLMLEHEVRRLPVVDHDLVGIVTYSDILRNVQGPLDEADTATGLLLSERKVRDVMTYDPVTINPSATIQEAAERMLEFQVSGLPVVRNGKAIGIITESDIFRLVVESWSAE